MPRYLISNLLGLAGAIAGGVLGFYTFQWLLGYGFYGLMIPGAFLGLGCSLLARHASVIRGVFCGIAALVLSFFTDWYFTITDESFATFVSRVKDFNPVTLLMIAVGTLIAFWIGKDAGMRGYARVSRPVSGPTLPARPTETPPGSSTE
jgi:hypothetical protein